MTTGKEKSEKMKADTTKKRAALVTLQSLNGKKPEDMTKPERAAYDRAIGQLLGILDAEGKVNVS